MHSEALKQEEDTKSKLDFSEATLSWCTKAMRCIQEGKQCENPPVQNLSNENDVNGSQPASASGGKSAKGGKNTGGKAAKDLKSGSAGGLKSGSAGGKASRGNTPKTPGGGKMQMEETELNTPKLDQVVSLQVKYEAIKIDMLEKLEFKKADHKATSRRVESTLLQAVHIGSKNNDENSKQLFAVSSEQLLSFPRGHGHALLAIQQTKSNSFDMTVTSPLLELSKAMDTLEEENFKQSKAMKMLNNAATLTATANDTNTNNKSVPPTPTTPAGGVVGGGVVSEEVELSKEELLKKAVTISLESASAELAAEIGLAALLLTNEEPPKEDEDVMAVAGVVGGTNDKNAAGGKNTSSTPMATDVTKNTTLNKEDVEKAVLLAHRCLSRAMTSKDTTPTASIKMDFLKCQLMVLEFEGRDAVSTSELATGAVRKEEGTKLVQLSMRQASLNVNTPYTLPLSCFFFISHSFSLSLVLFYRVVKGVAIRRRKARSTS